MHHSGYPNQNLQFGHPMRLSGTRGTRHSPSTSVLKVFREQCGSFNKELSHETSHYFGSHYGQSVIGLRSFGHEVHGRPGGQDGFLSKKIRAKLGKRVSLHLRWKYVSSGRTQI